MAIWLCSDKHEEICHEGSSTSCPACEVITELEEKVEVLEDKVESLTQELADLAD